MAKTPQDQFTPSEPVPSYSSSSVGTSLRSARERTGKGIEEVAKLLRIRQPFLEALEDGRHKDLPGGTYAIGFLRSYAEFLQLDGEEMVRRFKQEAAADLNSRSELVFPSPVSEGRVPTGSLLLIGMVLAAGAYGGWYWLNNHESDPGDTASALPERLLNEFNRPASLLHGDKDAKPDEAASKAADAGPAAAPGDDQGKPADGKVKDEIIPPAEEDASKDSAKPEEPKAEGGKPDSAKVADAAPAVPAPAAPAAAVKPEAGKAETPKPAEPAMDAPKPADVAKVDAPKADAGKPMAPKADAAKAQPAKVDTGKPQPTKADAPKADSAKTAETGKPTEAAKPAEPAKVEAAAAAPAATPAAPAPTLGSGPHSVVVRATADDCWIQVREMDGQLLVSRLLRKGDAYSVPDRPGLTMTVGNAGAVQVSVDGKPTASLGGTGEVRRDISLDPGKLLSNP